MLILLLTNRQTKNKKLSLSLILKVRERFYLIKQSNFELSAVHYTFVRTSHHSLAA